MPFDHVGVSVANFAASRAFYATALAPLGIGVVMEGPGYAGFGEAGKPEFWLGSADRVSAPVHIAFRAKDRAHVRAFYDAAIAAGGKDNGGPGLRPEYHPDYYGAFVLDPDGHNIEAVCHQPE